MFGSKKDPRFIVTDAGTDRYPNARVMTDRKTGVQYLYADGGDAAGLIVLVDRQGNPLIDEEYEAEMKQ